MSLLDEKLTAAIKSSYEKNKRPPEPSLLGAFRDPQFLQDVKRGVLDSVNRGAVASTIGGPVDLATMVMRLGGYNVEKPMWGSEWVGDKMQQMGLIGETRNPIAEALASVAVPAAMGKAGKGLFKAEQTAIQNANIAGPLSDGKFATQRGVFGGINAKTADKAKLAQAEQMLSKGVDPAQVWKETGWGRGPDGKWRFEISDKYDFADAPDGDIVEVGANMLTGDYGFAGPIGSGAMPSGTVRQIMRHDDLFNAYPDTAAIRLSKFDELGGEYGPSGIKLNGGKLVAMQNPQSVQDIENVKSPLLHELQHAIQQREGFARGGSPEQFATEAYDTLVKRSSQAQDAYLRAKQAGGIDPETGLSQSTLLNNIDGLSAKIQAWKDPHQQYLSLGGEAEARLVQARMNLTPEERAAQFPFNPDYFKQQAGVGIDDLIHRFDGGEAKSIPDWAQKEAMKRLDAMRRGESVPSVIKNGLLTTPEQQTNLNDAYSLLTQGKQPPYPKNEMDLHIGHIYDARMSGEVKPSGKEADYFDSSQVIPWLVRAGDDSADVVTKRGVPSLQNSFTDPTTGENFNVSLPISGDLQSGRQWVSGLIPEGQFKKKKP